jgi:hypothetical protein
MYEQNQPLDTLEDIKQMMHKSSRFVSLSGWSGVSAGICALIGAWVAKTKIQNHFLEDRSIYGHYGERNGLGSGRYVLSEQLLLVAILTFIAALVLAFVFTYMRSKKSGIPVWGYTARRVMINVSIPMIVGGILIFRMLDFGFYGLIAPACLLFYGLGLINASKYTLTEIRYLGFSQIILGIINLWMIGYGLYFWAIGFGVLHIIYGIVMWNRYERNQ